MIDMQTISLLVAFVGLIATGIWKLSRVEKALSDKIIQSRDEIESKQSQDSHYFGETAQAIRQKIYDVELYAANNYVRRDGFFQVQEELRADIRGLGDKIEQRFVRLESKIDTKT